MKSNFEITIESALKTFRFNKEAATMSNDWAHQFVAHAIPKFKYMDLPSERSPIMEIEEFERGRYIYEKMQQLRKEGKISEELFENTYNTI